MADSYSDTAYGKSLSASTFDANPFQYGGKFGYYSEYNGAVLCGHRWYDTHDTLRWLSRDPIGYEGGDNLYAYCGGDPVDGIDPDGTGPAGAAIVWLIKLVEKNGIKYRQLVRPVSLSNAAKIRNAGGNILVRCQNPKTARRIANKIEDAVPGRTIEHDPHDDPNIANPLPHFQTNGSLGHTFYSGLTLVSWLLPLQFQYEVRTDQDKREQMQQFKDDDQYLKNIFKHLHH